MNMPKAIQDEAERLGLSTISTGGGFDYVSKTFDSTEFACEVEMTLMAVDGPGGPDSIREPCVVTVWRDHGWDSGVSVRFPDCRKAMRFMAAAFAPNFF